MFDIGRALIVTAVGSTAISTALAITAYMRRPNRKTGVIKVVSDEDAKQYAGKHVLTDGLGGPVVASGDTIGEMYDETVGMDSEAIERLVYMYVSKKGREVLPPLKLG